MPSARQGVDGIDWAVSPCAWQRRMTPAIDEMASACGADEA